MCLRVFGCLRLDVLGLHMFAIVWFGHPLLPFRCPKKKTPTSPVRSCSYTPEAYLKDSHDWQPPPGENFTALHVAHLLSGLNKLKRSGLREPDVDSHVDILQVLADSYLVNQVIPAKLLILDMGMVTCGSGLCS